MQLGAFEQIIDRAAAKRASMDGIVTGETNAYRLLDGVGDGVPGIFVDAYAGHWLVQTQDVPVPEMLEQLERDDCKAIWWKELTHTNRDHPRWIAGNRDAEINVRENALSFGIRFDSGYSQGIFLDQRDNRKWLRNHCGHGDSVLNLFAYTCAFSVAAATSGASTTSVDLSSHYLDWGRNNFRANGIDCGADSSHRFFKWDTFDFLKMAARKKEYYSFIVCDPPTFSRNKGGKIFKAELDYASLVERCVRVLESGGTLMCSTNHRGITSTKFAQMVEDGVVSGGKTIEALTVCAMPEDFTGDAYLEAVRVRVA